MKILYLSLLILFIGFCSFGQNLKAGFDKEEYYELMCVAAHSSEIPENRKLIPPPKSFHLVYGSPSVGLDNQWELWTNTANQAVLCIRGSTAKEESWLANFYAVLTPASGSFQFQNKDTFRYHLSDDPRAAIHMGYLVSLAFLAKDIVPKIDSCFHSGIQDFFIMGHSQGGGISYLLTAYLKDLQKKGRLSQDIRFKTYCSAAPKPGNLYFAYTFEDLTKDGWSYNVISSIDWVPQTPLTVQVLDDFTIVNPMPFVKSMIHKLPFPKKQIAKYYFNQLDKPSLKIIREDQKLMGKMVGKKIKRMLPDLVAPGYYFSNNYVRTGFTIVLVPEEDYFQIFPKESQKFLIHHSFIPYLYLLNKY